MSSTVVSLTSSFATHVGGALTALPECARAGYTFLAAQTPSKFLLGLQKVKATWLVALPYVKASLLLCATPLGISIITLALSIIPLRLSRSAKTNAHSIELLALGILGVLVGGVLLTNAIPSVLLFSTLTTVS